jgi:hypothetical protein
VHLNPEVFQFGLVNKSSKKLHEDIKINSNNSTIKAENFMKIGVDTPKIKSNYILCHALQFLNQFLRESRNKII